MRRGLTRERVIEAALAVADADGLEAVTIARLAADLGVRPPSLYNHITGREDLLRAMTLRSLQDAGAALGAAAMGRAGVEALTALSQAWRTFAREQPGRYASTVRAPARGDAELLAAGADVVEIVLAALRAWELEGDDAIHAVRIVRAALHGFVALEAGGGFGVPVDVDTSFDRLVATLAAGLGERG